MRIKVLLLMLILCCSSSFMVRAEEMPEDMPLPQETMGPQPEQAIYSDSLLDEGGILFLVNREKKASASYVPGDLVVPKVSTRKAGMEEKIMMREDAAKALEEMFAAAKREAKHILYATSGYRSYGIQQILFNGKVDEVGRERAMRTVAPPGTSEHQMGLAMDVQAPSLLNLNQTFADTQEGQWVADNAHRFGFIIRYKQEWADVTGYTWEPWHIRYVGKAHSQALYELNIPYEQYHELIKDLPEYVLSGASDVLLTGLVRERLEQSLPEAMGELLAADTPERQDAALRAATAPYLPSGISYEQALWAIYPTPKPTAGPRVDEDEETSIFSYTGDAVTP